MSEESAPLAPAATSYSSTTGQGPTFGVDEGIAAAGIGGYHYRRYLLLSSAAISISMSFSISFIVMITLVCRDNVHVFLGFWVMALVFSGFMVGTVIAGLLCDRLGRKPVLVAGTWIIVIHFVLMSVTVETEYRFYPWHVGLGLGMGLVEFTYIIMIAEFATPDIRSIAISVSGFLFGLGSLLTSIISYFSINTLGWRTTILICGIPVALSAVGVCFVSETPKYLCTSGQVGPARILLEEIAEENGNKLPEGDLVGVHVEDRGNMREIFRKPHQKDTMLLIASYFLVGVVFYSAWSMLPFILQSGHCDLPYRPLTSLCTFSGQILLENLILTTSQLFFLPVVVMVNSLWGRLPALRVVSGILTVVSILLTVCWGGHHLFLLFLFIQRGLSQNLLVVLLIYTPELYPTHIRAVSASGVIAFSAVGGLVSSLIVWSVGYNIHWEILLVVLAVCSSATFILSWAFSKETKDATLQDGTGAAHTD